MLDLIHHIPRGAVAPLIEGIARNLRPGGVLLIKDVSTRPRWHAFNAWALDKIMYLGAEISQWSVEDLSALLRTHFATVEVKPLPDTLPFPNVLYVCRR
jgi:SAM-dependent methyltransferase